MLKWISTGLLLVSCATTGENMKTLETGMDKRDVVDQLGRPEGVESQGEMECYLYYNRLISGWSWDRADYRVCFQDGKLKEYKAMAIREKQPVTNVLVHHY